MDKKYDPQAIEEKWQEYWQKNNFFRVDTKNRTSKYYCLEMYPYPSGELHMGHVKNYIIGDVVARCKRMAGYEVLHPMGWDSFGLPAENVALERGINPAEWNPKCVATMKRQFKRLGISYDWEREIDTSSSDYYGWTQWLFLRFWEKGLAYKKKWPVNWCPKCATVLANEQVIEGLCERCDTPVVKKDVDNWFLKITEYAERLLEDISLLDNWPERVRIMQENWIGKSEGVEIAFELEGRGERFTVFTTRPDTIYGVTFLVLAPEHPLAEELAHSSSRKEEISAFIERAKMKSEIERTVGVEKEGIFTEAYAINLLSGERVPILISDYVLMDYGTGIVMGVPAHDQRDLEFARKYNLPVKIVIEPPEGRLDPDTNTMTEAYVEAGIQVNSDRFNGLPNEEAKERIADFVEERGIGRRTVSYKLRDWCISRQRYWGAPIPIVYCEKCGMVPVPDDQLPVLLPRGIDFTPGFPPPLARSPEFVNTTCPQCGGPAKRETNVMDTFVFSSWYFLRYVNPQDGDAPFVKEDVDYWLPVDQYIGGIEHATVHLIYSRFFTKVLYDLGMINFTEPFQNLFAQGMIYKDGAKMSKSKGNVVTPDDLIERYGADTARLYVLFIGPPELDAEWNDRGVEGCWRFLNRVWRLVQSNLDRFRSDWIDKLDPTKLNSRESALRRKLHQTIKKVTEDVEDRFHFNTAISAIMELTRAISQFEEEGKFNKDSQSAFVFSEAIERMIILLSPFVPHLAEELWHDIGREESVYRQRWPEYDEEAMKSERVTIVIQVNGKVRASIEVSSELGREEIEEIALGSDRVQKWIASKEVKNIIYVPNKLINIVA